MSRPERTRDLAEAVDKAWASLPHAAKMRMWADPEMGDLYWATARISAHVQAERFVAEVLGESA